MKPKRQNSSMTQELESLFQHHKEQISQLINFGLDEKGEPCLHTITTQLAQLTDAAAVAIFSKHIINSNYSFLSNIHVNPNHFDTNDEGKIKQFVTTIISQPVENLTLSKDVRTRMKGQGVEEIVYHQIPQDHLSPVHVILFFKKNCTPRNIVEEVIQILASKIKSAITSQIIAISVNQSNQEQSLLQLQLNNAIAELNEARLYAKESCILKSAFLANLSHEIRTPMNVILGFSELLKSSECSIEERSEFVDIIHQNGLQLLRILDNLIDISKLKTRASISTPTQIRLNELMDSLFTEFSSLIKTSHKQITLTMEKGLSNEQATIHTNHEVIHKCLTQLIDNAIKFTSEGSVCFGYTKKTDHLLFYIKDTGIGIPTGKEEIVFDLFRQANINATREYGGNGLGLALVRKYLGVIDGKVWLENNHDRGVTFYFTIPV